MQDGVYKTPVGDVCEMKQVSSTAGQVCLRTSSATQSTSGKCDSECMWRPRDATLSIFCIKTGSFQSKQPPNKQTVLFRATHDFQKKRALFLVRSLRDDNVITSKPTWKLKHTNSILEYSEYFCQISSKLLVVILSYTVLKFRRFFETQCSSEKIMKIRQYLPELSKK